MFGNGFAKPGHGCLDRVLAAIGGDADAQAHGLGFRGIRQISSTVQRALLFGMNVQADDAGIGISAKRQLQCGTAARFQFPCGKNAFSLLTDVNSLGSGFTFKIKIHGYLIHVGVFFPFYGAEGIEVGQQVHGRVFLQMNSFVPKGVVGTLSDKSVI